MPIKKTHTHTYTKTKMSIKTHTHTHTHTHTNENAHVKAIQAATACRALLPGLTPLFFTSHSYAKITHTLNCDNKKS